MPGTVIPPTPTIEPSVAESGLPAAQPVVVIADPHPAQIPRPPSKGSDPMLDAFADLDGYTDEKPAKASKPEKSAKPEKAAQKAKPTTPKQQQEEEPKAEEEQPAEVEKTDEEPKPQETKPAEQKPPQQPNQARELRTAYENSKTRIKQLETELATARAEKAKPAAEDPEKKVLLERLSALEKTVQEKEEKLRYTKYEDSDHYKETYEKPLIQAFNQGRQKAASLRVTDADGTVRQATADDFDRIMQVTDDVAAMEMAEQMFGRASGIVMLYRDKVQSINATRLEALNEFRKNGAERMKAEEAQNHANNARAQQLWAEENKAVSEKYDWARPKEGDDEGNKLLEKGFHLADLVFNTEEFAKRPLEEQVRIHATMRNRTAAFGRVLYWNKQLTARVAELEKELAEIKSSDPGESDGDGRPEGAGHKGGDSDLDWEGRLNAMAE